MFSIQQNDKNRSRNHRSRRKGAKFDRPKISEVLLNFCHNLFVRCLVVTQFFLQIFSSHNFEIQMHFMILWQIQVSCAMMAQKKSPAAANKLQCSNWNLSFQQKYFALCLKTPIRVSYSQKNKIMVSTIAQIITMRTCIFVFKDFIFNAVCCNKDWGVQRVREMFHKCT